MSAQKSQRYSYRWIKAKKVSEIFVRLACLSLQNSRSNLKYFAQITGSLASPPWNLLLKWNICVQWKVTKTVRFHQLLLVFPKGNHNWPEHFRLPLKLLLEFIKFRCALQLGLTRNKMDVKSLLQLHPVKLITCSARSNSSFALILLFSPTITLYLILLTYHSSSKRKRHIMQIGSINLHHQ